MLHFFILTEFYAKKQVLLTEYETICRVALRKIVIL